jgi:hypothetical protein
MTRFRLPFGRYSTFGKSAHVPRADAPTSARQARAPLSTLAWSHAFTAPMSRICAVPNAITGEKKRRTHDASASPPALRMRAVAGGITVTDTRSERPTEQLIASAMSRKSCPACSCTKRMGRKTARVVSVEATTAPHTSCVPLTAATTRSSPSWYRRKMFSRTTIALSTSMPTANARPARLTTFSDRPIRWSSRKVPMMLVGIASAITRVERPLRRNRRRQMIVRMPPRTMLSLTSPTAEWMYSVSS